MVPSEQHTAEVGDDESDEPDYTDERHTYRGQHGCQDEDEGVEPPDVETHLPRLILAEEHQIELLRIPQYDN